MVAADSSQIQANLPLISLRAPAIGLDQDSGNTTDKTYPRGQLDGTTPYLTPITTL